MKIKTNKGFSLVELIVVIAIMAIIAAVAVPVYDIYIDKAKMANDKKMVADVLYAINIAGQGKPVVEVEHIEGDGLKVPVGMVLFTEDGATVIAANDTNKNILSTIIIEDMAELESLKLQYDGWNTAFGSFFATSGALMSKVDTVGTNTLDFIHKFKNKGLVNYENGAIKAMGKNVQIISRDYTNADELTYELAKATAKIDRQAFINSWANLSSESSEGFGYASGAREFYSAVRAAYSQCVANYISANNDGHTDWVEHVADMPDYGESAGDLIASKLNVSGTVGTIIAGITGGSKVTFPMAVCGESFDHAADGTVSFFGCEECKAIWETYKGSDQAKADAAAFYDVMVTGASYDGDDSGKGSGIIDWAKDMTADFESLYSQLNAEMAGIENSILVTVYQDAAGFLYTEVNTPGVIENE